MGKIAATLVLALTGGSALAFSFWLSTPKLTNNWDIPEHDVWLQGWDGALTKVPLASAVTHLQLATTSDGSVMVRGDGALQRFDVKKHAFVEAPKGASYPTPPAPPADMTSLEGSAKTLVSYLGGERWLAARRTESGVVTEVFDHGTWSPGPKAPTAPVGTYRASTLEDGTIVLGEVCASCEAIGAIYVVKPGDVEFRTLNLQGKALCAAPFYGRAKEVFSIHWNLKEKDGPWYSTVSRQKIDLDTGAVTDLPDMDLRTAESFAGPAGGVGDPYVVSASSPAGVFFSFHRATTHYDKSGLWRNILGALTVPVEIYLIVAAARRYQIMAKSVIPVVAAILVLGWLITAFFQAMSGLAHM